MIPLVLLLLSVLGSAAGTPATPPRKPQPKPTPPPVLEGTVKDSQGKPLERALAVARCTAAVRSNALSARTDAAGRFQIPLPRPDTCFLRIEAAGFAPQSREKVRPGTSLAFVLERGGLIQGTVRDAGGGPIPQAQVVAETGRGGLTWEPGTGAITAVSDAQGRYRLEGVGRESYDVSAVAHGYGRLRRTNIIAGSRVDFVLSPGASVSGTVLGPDQKPAKDAVVRIERRLAAFTRGQPTRTDAQGRFDLPGVEPGPYLLVAVHAGLAPALAPVDVDGETSASLTLGPPVAVSGRLLDAAGHPVPGQVAVQELNGTQVPASLAEILRAEAGADGRFRIEAAPAGSHALLVGPPRFAPKRVEFDAPAAAATVELGDIALEVGLAIRGRVRDRGGRGVAGAHIHAWPAHGMAPALGPGAFSGPRETDTEDDGSFLLAGVAEGTYRLSVSASGYGGTHLQAAAGAQPVEITLTAAGTVSGVVVDESGRPVETYEVTASGTKDGPEGYLSAYTSATSPDGAFRLEDVAEGVYVVKIAAPDHAPAVVSGVGVTTGSTVDLGRIRLSAGGTLRGTVVEAGGGPVAGAALYLRTPGVDWDQPDEALANSDLNGRFEIKGLSPGTVAVVARHPQYAEGVTEDVNVDPARAPAETRVVLTQGARVEGVVRRRPGVSPVDSFVQIWPLRGAMPSFSSASPRVPIRSDGTFVVEHLPPGPASAHLMQAAAGGRMAGSQSRPLMLREGETTTVEFGTREIRVSGRITRAGVPAPHVQVSFRGRGGLGLYSVTGVGAAPPSGPQYMMGVSGDDGSYELLVDASGAFAVRVASTDGSTLYSQRNVEVPDEDSWSLDIDVTGATIPGIVVDAATGQPVGQARVYAHMLKPGPPVSSASTGSDGRFELVLDDGDYRLAVGAEGYQDLRQELAVAGSPTSELHLALSRGASIKGKVVDVAGRGVPSLEVSLRAGQGPDSSWRWGITRADGSFELSGLPQQPCILMAGTAATGWAIQSGVTPAAKEVRLALRPGGLVKVRVQDAQGQPVEGAFVGADTVSDIEIDFLHGSTTDAEGVAELAVPAGTIELRARKEKRSGTARLPVGEGANAAVVIKLSEASNRAGAP